MDTPVDFMTAFANHLPLRVSRNLFEIPPEMDEQLTKWNAALIKIGDIMMSPDQKREALTALREYKDYLRGYLASRRANPGDGFIGLALEAMADGTIDEDETLNNILGLASGNETTVTLLGNGLLSLLRHPAQFDKLRSNPALMRSAIEEMLRYEPSINFILRVAIKDFRCGEFLFPPGRWRSASLARSTGTRHASTIPTYSTSPGSRMPSPSSAAAPTSASARPSRACKLRPPSPLCWNAFRASSSTASPSGGWIAPTNADSRRLPVRLGRD